MLEAKTKGEEDGRALDGGKKDIGSADGGTADPAQVRQPNCRLVQVDLIMP